MTVKDLKELLTDLPEDHELEVRLRGSWLKEFTLRVKYVKLIGHSQVSHQTAADDE